MLYIWEGLGQGLAALSGWFSWDSVQPQTWGDTQRWLLVDAPEAGMIEQCEEGWGILDLEACQNILRP